MQRDAIGANSAEFIGTTGGTDITPTEDMIQSLIPHWIEGDKQAAYLGYLVAGFSKHQAVKMAHIHPKTLKRWMTSDQAFIDFVSKMHLPDIRHTLNDQILDLEFTRNFKLILAKDFAVLYKDAVGIKPLSEHEQDYLTAIRKFYTPQHLVQLRMLLSGKDESGKAFDFTQTVIEVRLSKTETRVT